jgi:hypothetical protein
MSGATYGGAAWSGSSDFTSDGYADLAEVKQLLQVDPTDLGLNDSTEDDDGHTEWDRFILRVQRKAKAQIDSFTQRDFEPYSSQTLYLDGGVTGSRVLRLPHPVQEVHEVKEDGTVVSEDSYEWQPNGSLIKTSGTGSDSGIPSRYGSSTPYAQVQDRRAEWATGYNNIEVMLDYGYLAPPEDVKEAEAMLIDHSIVGYVQKREAPVVQSDDFSIEANIPVALTKEVKEMLREYQITKMGA